PPLDRLSPQRSARCNSRSRPGGCEDRGSPPGPDPAEHLRSQSLHQPPPVEISIAFVAELVEKRARHGETASGFVVVSRHLARKVLVDREARVAERRHERVAVEAKRVLHRPLDTRRTAVREDVATDLAEGGLEEDEGAVVLRPARGFAQKLDRAVQDVQTSAKLRELRVELKGLVIAPHRLKSR